MSTSTIARTTLFVGADEDPSAAIETLRMAVLPGEFIAFDVETNALHPSDPADRLTSIQVGGKSVAVLLDPSNPTHAAAARELLNDPTYRLTAHNAGFDILRLTRAGVFDTVADGWARTTDTMILLTLLVGRNGDETKTYRDLKSATAAWCGADAVSADAKAELAKVQKEMGTKGVGGVAWNAYRGTVTVDPDGTVEGDPEAGNTWAQIERNDPVFQTYCASDIYDSAALAETLDPVVRGLWPEQVEREHRAARLVCEMTHRGVRLDREKTVELLKDAYRRRDEAAELLVGHGVTEPGQDEQVADAIRAEGVEVTLRTPSNGGPREPELDKRSLKKYAAAGSVVAPEVRHWRQSSKEISTYYEHYLRTRGDRVHAEIVSIEAKTGRMASKSPNLQNVPAVVKPCLVADPGKVLISADFSSVEMRVAAGVTGDETLSHMYIDPLPENPTERQVRERDPYWQVAWEAFGDDASEVDRKLAKIIVLAHMYGGGAATLAAQADISIGLVNQILAGYRQRFKTLKQWWNATMSPVVEAGTPFWTLPSGRFQAIDPTRSWAGLNMMIQGQARDLLLDALFRCEDAGLGEAMLLPIHDEILFQVPESESDTAAERIEQAMRGTFRGVPITVGVKVLGYAWKDKD